MENSPLLSIVTDVFNIKYLLLQKVKVEKKNLMHGIFTMVFLLSVKTLLRADRSSDLESSFRSISIKDTFGAE